MVYYDIAFLGGIFPKEEENEILNNSKGNIQNAANILQWNYIEGLDFVNKTPVKILNSIFIGSYPRLYKKCYIKAYNFSHKENAKDKNIKFINFKYYKNISRRINIYKELKKWAKENNTGKKVLFIYSIHSPFLSAAYKIKKKYKDIKMFVIVPDLPEFMNLSQKRSLIYKVLGKVNKKLIEKTFFNFDHYILLTEHMANKLNLKDNYIVIEGMININEKVDNIIKEKKTHFDILYSGTLSIKYGVMNIVNAMKYIDNDNCRLIICGDGEARDSIIRLSNIDKRIVYKGLVKREQVLELQRNANLVVNIRPTDEEYTKYSFPSKNMEYLASGTPLLTTILPGMPEEYKRYVYLIEDESIEGIANNIKEIMKTPQSELNNFGLEAKKWLFEEKNNIRQTKKVLELLND